MRYILCGRHLSCSGGRDEVSAAGIVGGTALPLLGGLVGYVLEEQGLQLLQLLELLELSCLRLPVSGVLALLGQQLLLLLQEQKGMQLCQLCLGCGGPLQWSRGTAVTVL